MTTATHAPLVRHLASERAAENARHKALLKAVRDAKAERGRS